VVVNTVRRHFVRVGNCIPAARMVLEFCNAIGVPCRVANVIAVVRNQAAKELNIWPFTKGTHDPAEAERRGSACVVVGYSPKAPVKGHLVIPPLEMRSLRWSIRYQ